MDKQAAKMTKKKRAQKAGMGEAIRKAKEDAAKMAADKIEAAKAKREAVPAKPAKAKRVSPLVADEGAVTVEMPFRALTQRCAFCQGEGACGRCKNTGKVCMPGYRQFHVRLNVRQSQALRKLYDGLDAEGEEVQLTALVPVSRQWHALLWILDKVADAIEV